MRHYYLSVIIKEVLCALSSLVTLLVAPHSVTVNGIFHSPSSVVILCAVVALLTLPSNPRY